MFERVFGLAGLDSLPDPGTFDPSPEDERDLRERLLKAGEARAGWFESLRLGSSLAARSGVVFDTDRKGRTDAGSDLTGRQS